MYLASETLERDQQAERAYIEEQVVAVQGGQAEAFAEVYPRILPGIAASLARLTDSETATNFAHEGIAHAFEKIERYEQKPGKSFESWTFIIARNAMIDEWRRRQRAGVPVSDEDLSTFIPAAAPDDTAAEAIERDAFGRIDSLFDQSGLAPNQKKCITLYHVEGLSYQEIADTLNIPIGSVRSSIAKGLTKLRASHNVPNPKKSTDGQPARIVDLFAVVDENQAA